MAGVPPKLKAVAHHVKIAQEYAKRDPAIQYWCLLYSVQKGMEIDKSSPECKQFLIQNMSMLEQIKKQFSDNEAITNDTVASAHVEGVALQLFAFADTEDRAGRFTKNVVKAFYTAGVLFDTLSIIGEVDSELQQKQKYAKWKAAYIHKCLSSGEMPVPGPLGGEEEDEFGESNVAAGGGIVVPSASAPNVAPTPFQMPESNSNSVPAALPSTASTGSVGQNLQTVDYVKAQKFCKYAISALEYEDAPTAVENLKQALEVLQMSRK